MAKMDQNKAGGRQHGMPVRISSESYRKLSARKQEHGLPIAQLIDIAVDLADRDWERKGIHIPPATAGRG